MKKETKKVVFKKGDGSASVEPRITHTLICLNGSEPNGDQVVDFLNKLNKGAQIVHTACTQNNVLYILRETI